jgi:hypothetical protein
VEPAALFSILYSILSLYHPSSVLSLILLVLPVQSNRCILLSHSSLRISPPSVTILVYLPRSSLEICNLYPTSSLIPLYSPCHTCLSVVSSWPAPLSVSSVLCFNLYHPCYTCPTSVSSCPSSLSVSSLLYLSNRCILLLRSYLCILRLLSSLCILLVILSNHSILLPLPSLCIIRPLSSLCIFQVIPVQPLYPPAPLSPCILRLLSSLCIFLVIPV